MASTNCQLPQLSDMRFDPISARPTLFAKIRAKRPEGPSVCPGCNEGETPPAVCVFPQGSPLNSPGWQIRVVPNKFPCLAPSGGNLHYDLGSGFNGIKDPSGRCEVLFETARHNSPIYKRSQEEVVFLLRALVSRYEFARSEPQAKLFLGFKNMGKVAGGTLEHEHWQIYSLSFIPPAIQDRYDRAVHFYNRTGRSLYRDMFSAEDASGERVVSATEHFITFVPFAAGTPYELRIAPRRDSADFSTMTGDELIDFSRALRDAVARLCDVKSDLAYNVVLDTASFENARAPWFCWSLSIIPRITTIAGVELGLDVMINPVSPEDAAAELRAASVK